MKLLVFSLILLLLLPSLHAKERANGREKPVVYIRSTKESEADPKIVKARYGTKYRIVVFRNDPTYLRSENTKQVIPKPQRDVAGKLITGSVRVCFIVTAGGRVAEPFVLRSSNPTLDSVVLEAIKYWRGAPARLHGQAIPIILYQDFTFH
jgi:TonB family protein